MSLAFICLVVAHYVIIIEFNMPLIFLRSVSILVPFVFGFLCRESNRPSLLLEFIYGLVVAVSSILVMATIVGKIDHVPVLPRNGYEWREFAEYGASIAFGFLTGVIIRQTTIAVLYRNAPQNRLIAVISRFIVDKFGRQDGGIDLRKVHAVVSLIAATISAVVSFITGLGHFF